MSVTTKTPATAKKTAALSVNDFLASIPVIKKAEAITEPGSSDGPSSHPTAKAEDHVQTAPEGEQTKENTKQVKEQVGPASVDAIKEGSVSARANKMLSLRGKAAEGSVAEPGTEGTAADDQLQIGTKKTPTGEDPQNETGMTTSGYPDPGTAHPAATDNSSLNGGKYANFTQEDFTKLSADESIVAFNKLAEAFFNGVDQSLNQPVASAASAVPANSAALHAKAGAAVADAVIQQQQLSPQESYELAQHKVASWVSLGLSYGDLVADFLDQQKTAKLANEMAGGMPPEGPGPEEMPPEEGGGGEGGGGGGGGGDIEAELASLSPEQLAQLLQQLGVSPEELEGVDAEGGGMPPPAPSGGGMGGGGGMPVMASARAERRKKANLHNAVKTIAEIMRRSSK